MNWLRNLSIAKKIALSFLVLLFLVISFGTWTYRFSNSVYQDSYLILTESQPFAQLAQQMSRDVIQVQQWLTDISATRAQDGLDDGFSEAEASYKSFLKGLQQFEEMYQREGDSAGLQAVKQLRTRIEDYYNVGQTMAKAYISGGPAAGNREMANFDQAAEDLSRALVPFVDQQTGELRTALTGLQTMAEALQTGVIAICLVVALLILSVGLLLVRSIATPLKKTVEMIQALEQGNLEQRLNMTSTDEVGIMAQSMDKFADNLRDEVISAFENIAAGNFTFKATGVIRQPLAKANAALNEVMAQIQIAGEQIASGSNQISDSSQTLSQGATEQASSLEEISASLNELSSQTTTNAENATQANCLATEVQSSAQNGSHKMAEMVAAMNAINESGQNISKIIKSIDEIAFQTNLLALNAAVEAARAGQHGKGFAVVAEEVRNLAARSAKAASETADLIEASVEKTANGSVIANETATALDGVVNGIGKVTDLVAEIAAASKQQAQGVGQINHGVTQIDQVTQQNTGIAEESASAAEELTGQADQLHQMLMRFTLEQRQGTQTAITPTKQKAQANISWKQVEQEQSRSPQQKHRIELADKDFGKY